MPTPEATSYFFTAAMPRPGAAHAMQVRVHVDASERMVTLEVDEIDSAVILELVVGTIFVEHGILAFTDRSDLSGSGRPAKNSDKGSEFDRGGAPPSVSPFGFTLRLKFDGRFLAARVIRLASGAMTLQIDGAAVERRRMALASAPLVLEALHDAGFRAVIGGSVGRGEKGRPESDLNVFLFGTFDEINLPMQATKLAMLAEKVSTVPVSMDYEHWIANVDPANYLMERHLAWDPAAKRCVSVAGAMQIEDGS